MNPEVKQKEKGEAKMRNSLRMIQYTLYALLIFALSGCGATKTTSGMAKEPGKITANLVLPKSTGKTVAAQVDVTKIRLIVTGADIPTAKKDFTVTYGTLAAGDTLEVTSGSELIVTAQAYKTDGSFLYEGFATDVTVAPNGTTTVTIQMNAPVIKAENAPCIACHESTRDKTGQNLVADYKQSGHYTNISWTTNTANGSTLPGCAGCHGTQHNVLDPAASGRCYVCHNVTPPPAHNGSGSLPFASFQNVCNTCHNAHNSTQFVGAGCTNCHSVKQDTATAGGNVVNDNIGVRAITAEFTKRSHHITSSAPHDAQCVVCHLEGKAVGTAVVVDPAYHMKDQKIYLRNADTDAAFEWSGTEHTNMDNFCFSCHDSNGATSPVIAKFMTGKNFGGPFSPTNPFADTLTNSYDQVARAGVVDVKTAFTTTNASHHAVSGQRYTYRFSTVANAAAWAARTGNPVPAASEIAEGHVATDIDGNPYAGSSPFGTGVTYDPVGPEEGGEATLYEAGKFVSTYIPLGATKNVADNSTLHCGDCHTVGQWRVGSSTNADGSATTAAIGAHGSANDYLLRNSEGTDAIHNGRTYVCFNCHSASSPTNQEANTLSLWNELIAEVHILPSTASGITSYVNSNGLNPVTVPVNKPATAVPSWKAGWNALHPTIIVGGIHGYASAHAVSAMHIQ